MCFSSKAPEPKLPPTPPPPPPVLEQSAPETAAPKDSESMNRRAQGVKQYRSTTNLGITNGGTSPTANNNGLGITM